MHRIYDQLGDFMQPIGYCRATGKSPVSALKVRTWAKIPPYNQMRTHIATALAICFVLWAARIITMDTEDDRDTWHRVPHHLTTWSVLRETCRIDDFFSKDISDRVGAHEGRLMTRSEFGSMFAKEASAYCAHLRDTEARWLGDMCFHIVKDGFDCALGLLFRVSRTSDRP